MVEENARMMIDFIGPSAIELSIDQFMRVNYRNRQSGDLFEGVDIKLMFPLSNKNSFLVIYHDGSELGVIRDYRELDSDSRKVVEHVLDKHYFVPEIKQVLKVREKYRLVYWEVVTDRGNMNFYTRTRNDVVIKDNQVFIRDIDSNRYLIKDHTALSPQSQRELSSEI